MLIVVIQRIFFSFFFFFLLKFQKSDFSTLPYQNDSRLSPYVKTKKPKMFCFAQKNGSPKKLYTVKQKFFPHKTHQNTHFRLIFKSVMIQEKVRKIKKKKKP